jgi:hypothetical protein
VYGYNIVGVNAPNEKELRTVRDARKSNPLGLVNQILQETEVYTLTVASVDINGIVYFIDDKTNYSTPKT